VKRMSPKKLNLNRETLRELTSQQASQVAGGVSRLCTSNQTCNDTCVTCRTTTVC
jgi:hypothetical protein